jgi:predicted NAD/FAD-dependent oxidoreductase
MKHVAVLGGGIGGVEAAIALRQEECAITLISESVEDAGRVMRRRRHRLISCTYINEEPEDL